MESIVEEKLVSFKTLEKKVFDYVVRVSMIGNTYPVRNVKGKVEIPAGNTT